jgi:hypothetical protein
MSSLTQQQERKAIKAIHEQSFVSLVINIRPSQEQLEDLREYKYKCDGDIWIALII